MARSFQDEIQIMSPIRISVSCVVLTTLATAQPPLDWVITPGDTNSSKRIVSISAQKSGAVYLVGDFGGDVDFDPSPGAAILNSATGVAFIAKYSPAGTLLWARNFGPGSGSGSHILINRVGSDTLDNIYISGNCSGVGDFDPGAGTTTLSTTGGGFISKINGKGDLEWVRVLHGGVDIYAVRTDPALSVYIGGQFTDTVDFDPGPATFQAYGGYGNKAFIMKLTATGSFRWMKYIEGPANNNSNCHDIGIDRNAGIYYCGYAPPGCDLQTDPGVSLITPTLCGFLCRLDTTGAFVKAVTFEGSCLLHDIVLTNGIVMSGANTATCDMDPGASTHIIGAGTAGNSGFIVKLDNNLSFLWCRQLTPQPYASIGTSLHTDKTGKLFLFANYGGSVDFDPGPGTFILNSPKIKWGWLYRAVASYDTSGSLLWAYALGPLGTHHASGSVTRYGDIYNAAAFLDTVDFDPSAVTHTLVPKYPAGSMYIQKLSQCVHQPPATLNAVATPTSVCLGYGVTLQVTGMTNYLWDHGLSPVGIQTVAPEQPTYYQVTGSDTSGCWAETGVFVDVLTCTGLDERNSYTQIFPNPAQDHFTCRCVPGSAVRLYSVDGWLIHSRNILQSGETISVTDYPSGIYLMEVATQTSREYLKVIKN